jgi:hypothetical protein
VKRELKEEEGGATDWTDIKDGQAVSEGQFLIRGLELEQQQYVMNRFFDFSN